MEAFIIKGITFIKPHTQTLMKRVDKRVASN